MTKKFACVLIILYVALLLASCSTSKCNINDIKQAIINITVEYENFYTQCLGTAVYADGYILTTAHSFAQTYDQTYISSYCTINAQKYALTIISIDSHNDLALLQCEYEFHSTLTYKQNTISDGDKLYLVTDNVPNHPLYKATAVSYQQIIEYSTYSRSLISITTNACYGDSGAPVVDTKGEIIGILCAKLISCDNTYFAIKSQTIQQFLEDI